MGGGVALPCLEAKFNPRSSILGGGVGVLGAVDCGAFEASVPSRLVQATRPASGSLQGNVMGRGLGWLFMDHAVLSR